MSSNSLIFHLVAHKAYYKTNNEEYSSEVQTIFYAISQVYIPLLNMFASLELDGIPFKMGMTISPTLCAQLSDPEIQNGYIEWLDKLIELGEKECIKNEGDDKKLELTKHYIKCLKRDKIDFVETFNMDLVSKFSYYAKKGNLELFATSATYSFLPHIADFPEAVNAQIEQGLISHKNFFGIAPEGFYLPLLGYTNGLEANLRAYGLNYTILDAQGLLFANPEPSMGIFSPVRSESSFAFFARDQQSEKEIFGKNGYMRNPIYRNQTRDIGFDSDLKELSGFLGGSSSRKETIFKYYQQKNDDSIYDLKLAENQAEKDAKDFVTKKADILGKASDFCGGKACSLVCTFDADMLGEKWFEGINWLEQVFREIAANEKIEAKNCCDITKTQYQFENVKVAFSSEQGNGYGENLLTNGNDWMIRYMRKNTERMIDLADRFSEKTGLKSRALNLATKEVLLSQSSDWPLMIFDKTNPDFAKEQFIKTINGFSTVYESLGSNTISTEWLTNLEKEHDLFPWTNYMIFSKKQ